MLRELCSLGLRALIAVMCALGCCFVTAVAAESPASFSADYAVRQQDTSGKSMAMAGKLWAAHGKIRRETVFEGHVMALILDPADHRMLSLVPDQGFYEDISQKLPAMDAMPGGPGDFKLFVPNPKNPCASSAGQSCRLVSTETVAGRSCDSWLITAENSHPSTWTECIDSKLGVIIRKEQGGRVLELTHIKEGKQSAALFRPSSDLRLVVLKGEL